MDFFPWWSEEHKQLSKDVKAFMEKIAGREMETRWTREVPFDLYEEFGKTGFTGAAIPKEYGGLGLGCTGGCIVAEEVHSVSPGMGRIIVGNMMGGLMQLIDFGTEEQKKKYLPLIAQGEMGCVGITEMTAGTDASGMEVEAMLEGDHYVLNGKKRYIVGAGIAQHYIVYAKSSNKPEDVKKHKHLTAFWVEKGLPGFTTERINEVLGFENVQNGSLDFENVHVPVANRIGAEGEGWKVLMHGLNFERTLISASAAAWQRMLLQYTVPYAQRRVQFGRPTIDLSTNQTKITDIIMRLKTTRMSVYYTAYMWDIGRDITVESSMVKATGAEATFASAADATQVMGGDGVNRFYPVQNIFEVAKTDFIAGGTLEACRLTIYRAALKLMSDDMQMPRRVISERLGVPIPTAEPVEKKAALSEESLLAVLGEDYRINQGLHMTIEDIQQYIDADAAAIAKVIDTLQEQNLVMTYRNRKGEVQLVKANYRGLSKAYPKEYYQWAPDYVTEDRLF